MPKLSSLNVEYQIKYSNKRKTIGISVDKKQGLLVSAPQGTPIDEIETIIESKNQWIHDKLDGFNNILSAPKSKEFVSGERLLYIGRSYRLQIKRTDTKKVDFKFHRGKFLATIPDDGKNYSDKIRMKTIKWYRDKALEKIMTRIDYFKPKIGKTPKQVRIKQFKARWGTTQTDGSIDFNWMIIMAPMSIIDFVVVHELCHLVAQSHSKVFWSKLSAIIIDHEKRREWLRINGATLIL